MHGCSTTTLGIHTGLTILSSGTILGTGIHIGYMILGTGTIFGITEATTVGIHHIIEEDITSALMAGDTATTTTHQ